MRFSVYINWRQLAFLYITAIIIGEIYFMPAYSISKWAGNQSLLINSILIFLMELIILRPFYWLIKKLYELSKFVILIHLISMPLYLLICNFVGGFLIKFLQINFIVKNEIYLNILLPLLIYIAQFALFYLFDLYNKQKESAAKSKELILKTHNYQNQVISAQIQPLFLLNTLGHIRNTIPADLQHTNILISKLESVFTFAFNNSSRSSIMIIDELEFLNNYLSLQKERFKERLFYVIDISPKLFDFHIPNMILQPIIENSLKHGISNAISGGSILVKISHQHSRLVCSVTDTGVGLENTNQAELFKNGIGLKNIDNRLKIISGKGLRISNNIPSGLIVSFEIPLSYSIAKTNVYI